MGQTELVMHFQAGSIFQTKLSLIAHDPDNDVLTFLLLDGTNIGGFAMDSKTSDIMYTTNFVLSRQSPFKQFNLTVCANDPGNLTATVNLTIVVANVNHRPTLLYMPANITGKSRHFSHATHCFSNIF